MRGGRRRWCRRSATKVLARRASAPPKARMLPPAASGAGRRTGVIPLQPSTTTSAHSNKWVAATTDRGIIGKNRVPNKMLTVTSKTPTPLRPPRSRRPSRRGRRRREAERRAPRRGRRSPALPPPCAREGLDRNRNKEASTHSRRSSSTLHCRRCGVLTKWVRAGHEGASRRFDGARDTVDWPSGVQIGRRSILVAARRSRAGAPAAPTPGAIHRGRDLAGTAHYLERTVAHQPCRSLRGPAVSGGTVQSSSGTTRRRASWRWTSGPADKYIGVI